MTISNNTIQQLLLLLRPLMETQSQRRGYLIRAFGTDTPLLHRLVLNTPTNDFIPNLVNELVAFGEVSPGKPALCGLLEVIREEVGEDVKLRINELLQQVREELKEQKIQSSVPKDEPREYKQISFISKLRKLLIDEKGVYDLSRNEEFAGVKTPPHLLFDLLLQMDFKQQVRLVEDVLEQHRTVAFLIHGEPDCGQELLVNRLFRLKSGWKNNSPIKNDVTYNAAYRSTERLWKQLGRSFLLPSDAKPEQIIDRICDRWQTQDVILIFEKVDCMPPGVLSTWLQELWEPLVDRGKLNPPRKETHLVMFLVDNCGSVCESKVMLAKQFDEPEYPRIPLHLPPVNPFPPEILKDWLRDIRIFRDLHMPANLTYQELWEKSDNGVPQFVYEEICTHFGLSWEGDLAKWLI